MPLKTRFETDARLVTMATVAPSPRAIAQPARPNNGNAMHQLRLWLVISIAAGLILFLAMLGLPYYLSSPADRFASPLHPQLRSTGTIGLKLGFLGVAIFGVLFLYPLRKRWKWLGSIGSTRRWLDFHVVAGVTAPVVITFHSAFRFHGLAGIAYWIMIVVALSGFVGRYVYAQLPRSLSYARLSMAELREQTEKLAASLREQEFFNVHDFDALLHVPEQKVIRNMNLFLLLWTMLRLDLSRPFLVSQLRRRVLHGPADWIVTLAGLFATSNTELEAVIASAHRQSRLCARMAFLDRAERIFHLWHVIHRPFSLSFVALVLVHIGVAASLGYF